jgi:hypothetical protein
MSASDEGRQLETSDAVDAWMWLVFLLLLLAIALAAHCIVRRSTSALSMWQNVVQAEAAACAAHG